jgi:hypothetical protein
MSGDGIKHHRRCLADFESLRKLSEPLNENNEASKMPSQFFKNRRVYLLTTVAYMGSLLFGESPPRTGASHED